MSDQRKGGIAWTEQTWNPVRGCSRVSAGCENCYAEEVARRFSGPGMPYEGLVRIGKDGKSKAQWNGVVKFVPEHLDDPIRWSRPRMVFVNSMSDLFHESIPFETTSAIFGIMAACPQHTFQVLTKRPERARAFFQWITDQDLSPYDTVLSHAARHVNAGVWESALDRSGLSAEVDFVEETWPPPNVWLGVSVENQETADERIPHLLECPAAVRWVSYEPALGPVDFQYAAFTGAESFSAMGGIDWMVVGGESGKNARPINLAWVYSAVLQCKESGVAVFVKQLGSCPYHTFFKEELCEMTARLKLNDRKGGDPSEWPPDLRVREFPPTKAQGRSD